MSYIGMCSPKGCGLKAVLVIDKLLILDSLVLNWVCCLEEATFSSLSIRTSTKAPHKLCKGHIKQDITFLVRS